ncbi:MAG: RC-LH1 core complex protein PufX [Rhodobacteraceae bacterium]|nr:RC-LH1 core complex protein PufX [Paracoccaceae bacterium]
MTKKELFDGDMSRSRILAEISGQMAVGAGIAGMLVGGAGVFIYLLFLVGTLLPPESKEAQDPTPGSFSSYVIHEVTRHS